MTDIIVILILALALGCALAYIISRKKKGARCIGCSGNCSCCFPSDKN